MPLRIGSQHPTPRCTTFLRRLTLLVASLAAVLLVSALDDPSLAMLANGLGLGAQLDHGIEDGGDGGLEYRSIDARRLAEEASGSSGEEGSGSGALPDLPPSLPPPLPPWQPPPSRPPPSQPPPTSPPPAPSPRPPPPLWSWSPPPPPLALVPPASPPYPPSIVRAAHPAPDCAARVASGRCPRTPPRRPLPFLLRARQRRCPRLVSSPTPRHSPPYWQYSTAAATGGFFGLMFGLGACFCCGPLLVWWWRQRNEVADEQEAVLKPRRMAWS